MTTLTPTVSALDIRGYGNDAAAKRRRITRQNACDNVEIICVIPPCRAPPVDHFVETFEQNPTQAQGGSSLITPFQATIGILDGATHTELPDSRPEKPDDPKVSKRTPSRHFPTSDDEFKMRAQEEDAAEFSQRKANERRAMASTHEGRAWLFIESVLAIHDRLDSRWSTKQVSPVSADDLVWLTERLMQTRKQFEDSGRPATVDLGYHFTSETNMHKIRRDGLMSFAERKGSYSGPARSRGTYFGDGVYTANNPFCFRHLGGVCLLVARLQGNVSHVSGHVTQPAEVSRGFGFDTIVGNKGVPIYADEVVLLRSSQCLPLFRFSTSLVSLNNDEARGNSIIHRYHQEMQQLVDDFLNGGFSTAVPRPLPSMRFSLVSTTVKRSANNPLQTPVAFPGLPLPLLPPGTQPQWNLLKQNRNIPHCMKKMLIFMLHGSTCSSKSDMCSIGSSCHRMKSVWNHFIACKDRRCVYQSCARARSAMAHYVDCREKACPICTPVRHKIYSNMGCESSGGNKKRNISHCFEDQCNEDDCTLNNIMDAKVKKPSEVSSSLWNRLVSSPGGILFHPPAPLPQEDLLSTLRGRAQRERFMAKLSTT
eukprot:CAMPEP_0197439404 /NCGR_PEP_ID=MMETSP1175-20131217/6160_1 /TAXON_ID=1003142 /ORGANISM="Triceratium dubium, Strain CCMP147" /LENGTH=594 /DNA_ID=CAMNT_0042969319 /DNA_START=193 /DNA_END=1977 /DNA_ORIENTATION=+